MKCYKFYFRAPQNNGTIGPWDLYAITNNNEIASNFMKQRNMKLCKVVKDKVDKSDYYKFADKHKMSILRQSSLTSIVRHSNSKNGYELIEVPMVMTEYEIGGIEEVTENYTIASITGDPDEDHYIPPYIFKEKIQTALEELEYHKFFIHKMQCMPSYVLSQETQEYINCADAYDMPNMIVDELSMFINIYSYTLFKHGLNIDN